MLTPSDGRSTEAWKGSQSGRAQVNRGADDDEGFSDAFSSYRIHLAECINGLKGLLLFWLNLVASEKKKGGFCHQL